MLIGLEGSSMTKLGENNYKFYVYQACGMSKQMPSFYLPGPAAISASSSLINIRTMANRAAVYINGSFDKVFVIGWSRGAAACIQLAHDLKRANTGKIDAMFLFDAVDQDTSTGADLNFIPDSVINVYHAIATKKTWMTRHLFPTCGRTADPAVNLVERKFNTTHAGIAGKEADDAGSKQWMWDNMRKEGVV